MTDFRGEIDLFVDESVYPFAIELARELDDSGALFNDDETPIQDPPIRLCLSIIANNSEGLKRLIHANVSKVGWSIMFPEPDTRHSFVFRAEDGSSAWVEQRGRMGGDGVVYTVNDEDAQSYRVYLDGQPCVLQPEEAEDDGHVLVTFPRHQVADYPVKRSELVPRALRPTFQSPYEQYKDRVGQRFTLVRPCTEADGFDIEVLPAYVIRFEDGTLIHAWPEEIDAGEIWQPQHWDAAREPKSADGDNVEASLLLDMHHKVPRRQDERETPDNCDVCGLAVGWLQLPGADFGHTTGATVEAIRAWICENGPCEHDQRPLAKIMEAKRQGLDCSADESASIKAFFDGHHPDRDEVARDLATLFPLEWDEWNEEKTRGARGPIVSWSDKPYIPIETFGLTRIDAERLLRFAAAAAAEGILNDEAAWRCGFTTEANEPDSSVVALAKRAWQHIEQHGL